MDSLKRPHNPPTAPHPLEKHLLTRRQIFVDLSGGEFQNVCSQMITGFISVVSDADGGRNKGRVEGENGEI